MTDSENEQKEAEARRKKKGDSGEGDSDSWGRGKAGAASAVGISLPPAKQIQVKADHRSFDIKSVVGVLAEFLSELPMKVSVNVSVAWDNTKSKSFAIVNWLIDLVKLPEFSLEKTRASVAESGQQGLQKQRPPKQTQRVGPNMNLGPTGPTGSQ